MRFNSIEHLQAYREAGQFPQIHDAIFQLCLDRLVSTRVLDLCCGHGLLGQRLVAAGHVVTGIDGSFMNIEAAKNHGVKIELLHAHLDRHALPALGEIISARNITAIVARRALPELFDRDLTAGRQFAQVIRQAGVSEILLEGRKPSGKATSPLHRLENEVALLGECYNVAFRKGALAYLTVK